MLKFSIERVVAIAIMLVFLTGCSGGNDIKLNPDDPVTITIWHYYRGAQKTAFDDMVREFNGTVGYEKGIIAEAVSFGGVNDLADNVIASARGDLDSESMPNVFGSYGDTALEIYKLGMAAEIDKYMTEEELSEYEESFIKEGRLGMDKLYVFPIAKSTESIMLNKTDFDAFAQESAEPVSYEDLATWEGIVRVSEIYRRHTEETGGTGKSFMGIDSLANYLIIGSKQLGQEICSVDNGKVSFGLDREIMFKLWDTYYEAMVTGKFAKLGKFCSDDVKTGDILCYVGSTTSTSYFPSELDDNGEAREIEMLALPMPVFENGEKTAVLQGAGMVVVKAEPEKEYASTIFLKWFTETERNVEFALNSSYLPVTKKALEESLLSAAFERMQTGDVVTNNVIMALRVGIEQIKDYNLYTSDVFDNSVYFRDLLPQLLSETAIEDRRLYVDLINIGMTPEQAYEQVSEQGQIKFDEWIDLLKTWAE